MTLGECNYRIGIVPVVDIFLRMYGAHLHRIFRCQAIELPQDKPRLIAIEIPWGNGYAYGEIVFVIIFQPFCLICLPGAIMKELTGPQYKILEIRRIRMPAIMLTPGKLPV